MKIKILILLFLLLIQDASAKELRCSYEDGIVKTVNLYQCPPVLKEFHKLKSQEESIQNYDGISGGGGSGPIYNQIPDSVYKLPEEKHIDWGGLIILGIILCLVIFIIIILNNSNKKKYGGKKNETKNV